MEESKWQKIYQMYLEGSSLRSLAIKFEVSRYIIDTNFKKLGLELKTGPNSYKKSLNHNAFSEITPESAYWIGFLMADGCVSKAKKANRIELKLAEKDVEHIEKFKKFLKTNNVITFTNNTKSCRMYVHSKQIAEDLFFYGVTPRKTFTAKVSDNLAFNRDFWRGVVDGDGCISYDKSGKTWRLSLVGSSFLMNQYLEFTKTIIDTKALVNPMGNVFTVKYNYNKAKAVIDYLYEGSEVYLNRKHQKAMEVLNRA